MSRKMKWVAYLLSMSVLACAGLDADVQGTSLVVDGQPWSVVSCESGAVHGFSGVELVGVDGRRIRLETRADGTADVFVFAAGAQTGDALGACATAAFQPGTLTINDIKAVSGGGTVSCEHTPVSVQGTVQVERCATPLL